jgi:transcriptional regulator of acetoin/glycerol metabolism
METQMITLDDKMFDRRLQLLDRDGNVRSLGDMEKEIIICALEHYRGRVSEAARRLKMSRSTLYRKMEAFKINEPSATAAPANNAGSSQAISSSHETALAR